MGSERPVKPCHICGGVPKQDFCSACIPSCDMVDGQCKKTLRIKELETELERRLNVSPEDARLFVGCRDGTIISQESLRAHHEVLTAIKAHAKKAMP